MGKCQNIIARRSGKITRSYGKNSFFVAEIWENMLKIINAEILENIAEI
jgi:hypothetical protein